MPKPPNNGPAHGRFQKTARKLFGQNRSDLMPLSPGDEAALGLGIQSLKFNRQVTKATLAEQKKLINAQFRMARSNIRQESQTGLALSQGEIAERGLLGSTVGEHARQDVLAQRDAALQEAKMQQTQARLGIKQQNLESLVEYRQGLANLALQNAAAQSQQSLDLYGGPTRNPEDYQIDLSAAERQSANKLANTLRQAKSVTQLTDMLNQLGYSSPQTHHDEASRERDINVYSGTLKPKGEGSTSPEEQRRLFVLAQAMRRAFGGQGGPLSELIFDPWGSYFGAGTRSKNPYGKHEAHLHFGFQKPIWG